MAPSPPQPKRQHLSTPSNNVSSLDYHLESVLALSDPSIPFDLSLERILESRVLQSDKEDLVHVAFRVGSALVDAARRSARKLGTEHNSSVWPLPPELTVKVLSFLDMTSLCFASATCTTSSKCASDPLCYANIDLTQIAHKVEDSVVSTMIQRAGKNLKSLKLGIESIFDSEGNWRGCLHTRSCLDALSSDNGASGAFLQKLSLNKIEDMDTESLILALSNCKSLTNLEIIGIFPIDIDRTLEATIDHCPLIERLCFDYSDFGKPPILWWTDVGNLIKKCNLVTSLSIRGCVLNDCVLLAIMKGLPKLKYADFSSSIDLEGSFLKDLGNGGDCGDSLETLILKDCPALLSDALLPFFNAVAFGGKWKSLKYIDLTSICRMIVVCGPRILQFMNLLRPELCLKAEFRDNGEEDEEDEDDDDEEEDEDEEEDDAEEGSGSSDLNGDEENSDSSSDDEVPDH